MIRTVYAGRDRLIVPDGWAEFVWHRRRYRVVGASVEFWSLAQQTWLPSLLLTVSAPKGRAR